MPFPWHLTAVVAANGRPLLFSPIYIHGMPPMCHTLCQVPWRKTEANKVPEVKVMITHATHSFFSKCLAEDLAHN